MKVPPELLVLGCKRELALCRLKDACLREGLQPLSSPMEMLEFARAKGLEELHAYVRVKREIAKSRWGD